MLSGGGGFQQQLECAQIELGAAVLTLLDAAYSLDLFGRMKVWWPSRIPAGNLCPKPSQLLPCLHNVVDLLVTRSTSCKEVEMAGQSPVGTPAQRLAHHCPTWHLSAICIGAAPLMLLLLLRRLRRHTDEDPLPAERLA